MKKQHLFKAIYLCLLVSSMIAPDALAKAKGAKSIPGTAIFVMASEQSVTITPKKLVLKEPYLNLEMIIPQFTGLNDSDFQKLLNKKLYREAKQRKKEVTKLANEYYKDIAKDNIEILPFEYLENYTPIASQNPYFVVEQFKYQYSGGAHGISELSYLVIDTAQNKLITLADLFKDNIDYRSIINQNVSEIIEIRRNNGEFFFSGSDGFQSIKEEQPFFINNKGDLVIVFNIYEIAPYVAGPQFITISKERLTPYLK